MWLGDPAPGSPPVREVLPHLPEDRPAQAGSPASPAPDRGPSLTPPASCGAGSRRAGLSL